MSILSPCFISVNQLSGDPVLSLFQFMTVKDMTGESNQALVRNNNMAVKVSILVVEAPGHVKTLSHVTSSDILVPAQTEGPTIH